MVLSFDEMTLHKDIQFDQASQTVHGPHDQVQVVMIRGLFKSFKQPIYYAFDETMSKEILFNLMEKLDKIRFSVECVTSDMGAKNMALWRQLEIKPGNSHFTFKDRHVQVVADVPHLLKLLRNHFLDKGFILKNGTPLLKADVQQILAVDSGELRIHHKLKSIHFDCKQSQRQRVILAAQVFSRTTASALRLLFKDKEDQANFIQLMNDCFDVLNSRNPEGNKQFDYALGLEPGFKKFLNQKDVLLRAKEEIGAMRTVNIKVLQTTGRLEPVNALLPFQKGFLVSIDAALELYDKIRNDYAAKFLLTSRINQDCLENFFSRIRYIGGSPDNHPGCCEFVSRFRLLVLGQSSQYIIQSASVQTEEEESDAGKY